MMKKTVQYFNIHMPYLPVPLLFQSLQHRYKEAVHLVFVWIEAASAIHLRRKVESLETAKPKKQTAIDFQSCDTPYPHSPYCLYQYSPCESLFAE